MEGSPLLVPKESVGDPNPVPTALPKSGDVPSPMAGLVSESLVYPSLPEVHADRVVLRVGFNC